MAETRPGLIDTARAALSAGAPPRVWSMIVTVFGDLAPHRGDALSGPVLASLLDGMGIRPEAMRVALHRLRKEGWIDSRRAGRTGVHSLTEMGRRQTQAASPLIYAATIEDRPQWVLSVLPPMSPAERAEVQARAVAQGQVIISDTVLLGRAASTDRAALCVSGTLGEVPDWMRDMLGRAEIAAAYAQLLDGLTRLEAALPRNAPASPVERAILRCLIVHGWRRIVLRHPALPARFFPDGWPGDACRGCVARLLARLERPSLTDLETTGAKAYRDNSNC